MINTLNIKQEQLKYGYFTVGSGKEVMLIMGSCRVAPYVNYFDRWNKDNGNRFTIHTLDPFNFNWNIEDERVDYETTLLVWQTDNRMLKMLKSVDIFIHEYYKNHGMFNCSKSAEKNIYQFGLSPAKDICIPNFNDYFILVNDILNFDAVVRKKAIQDINVIGKLSEQTKNEIYQVSQGNLIKFYEVCLKSDLPEFKENFKTLFKTFRYFHSYNHISKYFTTHIFKIVNDKYLKLELSDNFWDKMFQEDMFANSYTKLTELDIELYGYDWDEEIVPLAL